MDELTQGKRQKQPSYPTSGRYVLGMIGILVFAGLCILNHIKLFSWESYSVQNALIFLLMLWSWRRLLEADRRSRLPAFLFGFLFTTAYLIGLQLAAHQGIESIPMLLLLAGLAVFFSAPAACFYLWLTALFTFSQQEKRNASADRRCFFCIWGSLLLLWLPVFLAYYPGLFAYDVMFQIPEYMNHSFSTFQPLIHTLLLGGFYQLGELLHSYNTGFVLYTVIQAASLAAVLSFSLVTLRQIGLPKLFLVIITLFFGLCPIVSVLAISATKDVLFSALVLLTAVLGYRLVQFPADSQKRKAVRIAAFIACVAVMCLFRNNAIYALSATLLLLPALLRERKKLMRYALILLASILVFFSLSTGLQAATGAAPGSENEKYSLFVQCLARAFASTEVPLDSTVKAEIKAFLPNTGIYNPIRADAVKSTAQVEGKEKEFFQLWFRVLLDHHAAEYVDAFLYTTQGAWYIEDTSNANMYDNNDRQGFLLTDTKEGFGIEHQSKFPALESLYEYLFSANHYLDIPVLSLLFMPALYFWLCLIALFHAIHQKKTVAALVGLFLLLLYATILLGPCILIRYLFPFVLCSPFLLALAGCEKHIDRTDPQQA